MGMVSAKQSEMTHRIHKIVDVVMSGQDVGPDFVRVISYLTALDGINRAKDKLRVAQNRLIHHGFAAQEDFERGINHNL